MNEFSNFHKRLSDFLLSTNLINKVSWGDMFDLDNEKRNQYALAHIIYDSIVPHSSYNTVSLTIILADQVHDNFDNKLDVVNQMSVLGTMINNSFDGGSLYDYGYRLNGEPTMDYFQERFIMDLSGWGMTLSVNYPNNITRCS